MASWRGYRRLFDSKKERSRVSLGVAFFDDVNKLSSGEHIGESGTETKIITNSQAKVDVVSYPVCMGVPMTHAKLRFCDQD